ncbi:MAG: class I SAM-dependent methyltransferase [Armatimonadota bacterium]
MCTDLNNFASPRCNVCESFESRLFIQKDGYDIYRCLECGLAFTHPIPSRLFDQYDSSYFQLYNRRREFRLRRAQARLRQIELIIEPGRLLDIGCSLGYFVEAANARGWKACGLDASEYAVNNARKLGLDIRLGTLEQVSFPTSSFECVTMWDVLEHVPDPTRHMMEVRRILVSGGLAVIGTPDLGHIAFRLRRAHWRHLKPAEHIYYFSKSSIRALLLKTGFEIVSPPIWGARSFPGHTKTRFGLALSKILRPNDVMIVYARTRE